MDDIKIVLPPEFQQRLDFSRACFLQGLCTLQEYTRARRSIYAEIIADIEEGIRQNENTKLI